MIGLRTRRCAWPLTAIATVAAALAAQACSGKVQRPSDCASDASCGGAFGASGGKAEGGSAAVSGHAPDGAAGATLGTCVNGLKDPDEADIDCGSGKCGPCPSNSRCTRNDDCDSQFCKSGRCSDPTCVDKIKNQDETDVDCGGRCLPCDIGAPCSINADCEGESCVAGVCADHCRSKLQDSDETDIDCGGATCGPCADKRRCQRPSDCVSLTCTNNKCASATCSDGITNQDETDIDCGGRCNACGVGARCGSAADCDSYLCSSGKCSADLVIPAADVIDDFEDGDLSLPTPARGGRVGNWSAFGDGTGVFTLDVFAIERGTSVKALRTTGKGSVNWGSGFYVDLNTPPSAPAISGSYDASAFNAVTFWARAQNVTAMTVAFPDVDTDAAGNNCTVCGHHYYKNISVTPSWQRFTLSFSDLVLEPGGTPAPTAFKASAILSLEFTFNPGASYDVYVDDVAFIKM